MHEKLDAAIERENRRLDPSILKPPSVRSLNDIRKLVEELNPNRQKISNTTEIYTSIKDEDGKVANLSTVTKSKSKREHLIEGLDIVKRQITMQEQNGEAIEINGRMVKPVGVGSKGSGAYWIDPIIKQWLSAYRNNLLICWDLDGKTYQYDIYNHKLTAISNGG
jgi:hypothetical protein